MSLQHLRHSSSLLLAQPPDSTIPAAALMLAGGLAAVVTIPWQILVFQGVGMLGHTWASIHVVLGILVAAWVLRLPSPGARLKLVVVAGCALGAAVLTVALWGSSVRSFSVGHPESQQLMAARIFLGCGALLAILRSIAATIHAEPRGRALHGVLVLHYGLVGVLAVVWQPFSGQLFPLIPSVG